MDTQNLDAYFTNLVYEMEACRHRFADDREDANRKPTPPAARRAFQWLAGFAALWLGAVTIGFWL
jgi:hypothetical protein